MTDTLSEATPQIFISHRHADKEIADILRKFLQRATAGAVMISQSSYEGSGPEIGKVLNQELAEWLAKSEVVILVFSISDENWTYCMWECGVAFDPLKEDTRIVVLDCGGGAPAPLAERARVSVNDRASIRRFVRQLMTSSNFFARHGKPVTKYSTTDPALDDLADELFEEMRPYAWDRPDEEWPAWPFILLEFPLNNVDAVRNAIDLGNKDEVHAILCDRCIVSGGDRHGSEIFGMIGFERSLKFGDLVSRWQARNQDQQPLWARSLLNQLAWAVCWEFPKPEWALMKHANRPHWHAPMLLRVRRAPSKQCMQLRVYFPRFDIDESTHTVMIDLPPVDEAETGPLRLVTRAVDQGG